MEETAIKNHIRDLEECNKKLMNEMKELKNENEVLKFKNEALEELIELFRIKYESEETSDLNEE
jgi:predicted RNase H-like nuclease (RuvC/YqgF family)